AAFREYYVSPAGDDTNPGTKSKPFKTLAHARDMVRVVNQGMTGDIVVNLRGGEYPVTAPVEFSVADSGCNSFKVIYRAYGKEVPVISGGVPVTGWRLDHDRIFSAKLDWDGKLRNLYVNGARAAMTSAEFKGQGAWGEFTVKGDEPWAETPGRTLDGVKFNAADVPVLANPSDVELLQHRTWNFLVLCARDVTAEGSNTVIKLQQPYGAIAATMAWGCSLNPSNKITIRNAYEFLKSPGQFYFNRLTHTLYYYARAGEDMDHAVVIAPLSEGLLRISGNSTNDRAKNLVFTGLTFSYDHWLLQPVGGSRGMVGVQSLGLYTRFRDDGNWHKSHYDICDLPQATIELRNVENVGFERNKFLHLASGCAVDLVNDVVDTGQP
ncbi:MAG: carbohydrate-binding protein, partial [Verrucomicrobia bacterium]|nr:carbohydrate-binding protein [Verrucomicrobiota bacterium]